MEMEFVPMHKIGAWRGVWEQGLKYRRQYR